MEATKTATVADVIKQEFDHIIKCYDSDPMSIEKALIVAYGLKSDNPEIKAMTDTFLDKCKHIVKHTDWSRHLSSCSHDVNILLMLELLKD